VFGLLGKIDADFDNPRAYFVRTATHLWIDQQRRVARDRASRSSLPDDDATPISAEAALQ
jgi:DNA-directed RNA polymerase specialized sigma24 family protein